MSALNNGLLVLLVLLLAWPVLSSWLRREPVDLFQPSVMFSLFMLLGYVLPLPSFLNGTDHFTRVWDNTLVVTDRSLAGALIVVVLATLGFQLGLAGPGAGASRRMPTGADSSHELLLRSRRHLRLLGLLYTFVGLGLFALGVVLIGGLAVLLSGLGDRLRLFAGLNYLFGADSLLLVFALVWWGHLLLCRRVREKPFWAYAVFAFLASSLQGNKSTLLVFVLTLTLMYHLLYRRIPASRVLLGAILVFTGLTIYGLFVREYLVVGEFVTVDLSGGPREELYQPLETEIGGNFAQLQMLTLLVERVPDELPYQYGRTYLSLLTMPVPRWLWPGKPLPSTGILALAFWPERWLDEGTTWPPGLIGEMYMNFGAAGVFLGMALFGWLNARALASARRNPRHLPSVTLCALLLAMMPHYLRGEFVAPTTLLAMLAIPALFAWRFAFRQHPESRTLSEAVISQRIR